MVLTYYCDEGHGQTRTQTHTHEQTQTYNSVGLDDLTRQRSCNKRPQR